MQRIEAVPTLLTTVSPPANVKGTKTKTGCRTCKIRRIKCDEGKPHCFRCTRTGRICDGYEKDPKPIRRLHVPGYVALHPHASSPDIRAFDYFKQKALLGLMGFDYKSDFWTRTIPQLSEASLAVHRAALALSARHEHIYNNHDAKLSVRESDLRTLKQYNRSIRQLCESEEGQPVHVTLACCILFICLENLAGNHQVSRAHLSNGLRMLKEWHGKEVTSTTERELREQISLVFCRFDMQATALQGNREPELDPSFLGGDKRILKVPSSFATIYVAQTALERLELRLLYGMSTYSFANPASWTEEAILQAKIEGLLDLRRRFSRWKQSFDEFLLKNGATMQTRDLQLSVLLTLHHQTTTLMLDIKSDADMAPGKTVAENHRFTTINNLARSLINSAAKDGASFSADMGIIPPVFFVAMGAPDRKIRRDAIVLLKAIKNAEGFWNAATTARIAESVLAYESASALASFDADIGPPQEGPPLLIYDEAATLSRLERENVGKIVEYEIAADEVGVP